MTNLNSNNLPALIQRLEAATSLLESMVSPSLGEDSTSTNGALSNDKEAQLAAVASTDQPRRETTSTLPAERLAPAIQDFDAIISEDVQTYVTMSEEIGGLVAEQSAAVIRAFEAERRFLIVTTKAKKPDIQSSTYMEILKELQSEMGSVNDIREANRGTPVFNHLTTVSEGIAMLGWITIDPKPADYVKDMLGSAQYHGNRVINEYKEKLDRTHVEWVQAFYHIFQCLGNYVKQHYPTGVTWNNRSGIDPLEALREVQSGQNIPKSSAAPQSSGPPPPPPLPLFDNAPPPPPMPTNGVSSVSSGGGTSDMGAVFDQLSKGEAVTSRLRKVSPSLQTHKNPSIRANATVPTRSESQTSLSSRSKSPHPSKKPKPESLRTKKPPRKELDGNKWVIENFDSPAEGLLEVHVAIAHSILISRCTKTAIRIIGKANTISLDNCTQCSLVIDSLVSAVDVIKSPRFELQVLGTLPTIMLDQVDGAAIYLSRESLGTEVFTSKCSGINVNLPDGSDEDGYVERALPEQVRSFIRNGVMASEIVQHAG